MARNSSKRSGRLSSADGSREPKSRRSASRPVALVHPADLRNRLMRLVDEDDEVGREVVDQRVRRRAGRPPVEDPRVVLDPVAEAELDHHLDVVLGPLTDPVCLEHAVFGLDVPAPRARGGCPPRPARSSASKSRTASPGRCSGARASEDLTGERVEVGDLLDLVAEHRDAVGRLFVRRLDLDYVALDAEAPAAEECVVARVVDVDQLRSIRSRSVSSPTASV